MTNPQDELARLTARRAAGEISYEEFLSAHRQLLDAHPGFDPQPVTPPQPVAPAAYQTPQPAYQQPVPPGPYAQQPFTPSKSHKVRNIILGAVAVIVVIIVIISVSSGGSSKKKTADPSNPVSGSATASSAGSGAAGGPAPATTAAPPTSAPAPTSGGKALPLSSGDWRLDSAILKDDGLGDFGGTGRVTYTGKSSDGGSNVFTVTVFVGGQQVATLDGSVDSVAPGDQATIQFVSDDKIVPGPYTYDFQKGI
jgi:hypothetical protein